MPECDLVEVIQKGPVEVSAYGLTPASATEGAFELAERQVEKEYVQWLHAPCPRSCPGKLLGNPHATISYQSRPSVQDGDWWIGYAQYEYGGAVLCFGGSTFDRIQLSRPILIGGNVNVNVIGGENKDAKCGLNIFHLTSLQDAGDAKPTKEGAEASARAAARRAAEEWFRDRMKQIPCWPPCTNRVEFFEIRTRVIVIGQFHPGEQWAGIAEASGEGYIYCLDDETWTALINDLVERGVIADATGLLPR